MNILIPEAPRSAGCRNHGYFTWPNTDAVAYHHLANLMYNNHSNDIFKNKYCRDEPDKMRCSSSPTDFEESRRTLNDPIAIKVDSNVVLVISHVQNNGDL